MLEIRTTNLRFNLGKEPQRKAWQYLQTMDKSLFKSYNQAVATAVVDYFDRYYQTQDDPYLETRAREEQFVQQIVDAVRDTLRETMPVFLAGCMTGMAQNPAAVSPQLIKEPVKRQHQLGFCGWLICLCGLYRNVWTSLWQSAHSSRMNTPMLSVGLPTANAAILRAEHGRCCSGKKESSR